MKREIALAIGTSLLCNAILKGCNSSVAAEVERGYDVLFRQLLPKMLFPLQIAVIPKMHKSFIRISLIIVLSKKSN